MTLIEKFDKATDGWIVSHACEEIADDYAIEFALYLSENIYENMYQDVDNDGKTWVSYLDEESQHRETAERFTIQEILQIFKKEKGYESIV